MKLIRLFSLLLLSLMLSLVVVSAQEDTLPDEVVIEVTGLMPEGIAYDPVNDRFLVGSLSQGTIYAINDDGTAEPFIEDEDLMSTVGIHIDAANERLLVPNSNSAVFSGQIPDGPLILLGAYDLNTGERIFMTDLTDLTAGPGHFGNDVTVDDEGNAYLTDSFYPAILQVTPEGEGSVLIEDEAFAGGMIGLNGIDYHPDGFLLVAAAGNGEIYKIPLDNPSDFTQVTLEMPVSIDGMALSEDGMTLYAVARISGTQYIAEITSEDAWETATVANRVESGGNATTLTLRDGAVYAINAYLNQPQVEAYEIFRVDFGAEMGEMEATEEPVSTAEVAEPTSLPEGCEPGICLAEPAEACQCVLCGVECPADSGAGSGSSESSGNSGDTGSFGESGGSTAPESPAATPAPPVAPPPATTEEAGS